MACLETVYWPISSFVPSIKKLRAKSLSHSDCLLFIFASIFNKFASFSLNIFSWSNSKLCCMCAFYFKSSTIILGGRKILIINAFKYNSSLSKISGLLPTQPKQTLYVVKMAFLRLLKLFSQNNHYWSFVLSTMNI